MAKNGDVTLTGAGRCGTERAAAEALIADLIGVRTVTDDIKIRDDADPPHPGNEPREPAMRFTLDSAAGRLTPADRAAPDGFTRSRRPG